MAVTYSTTVKNSRLQVVVDAIDGGSPTAGGYLKIYTNASPRALLASVQLDKPCATVTGGVLTFTGLPNTATATGTGTAGLASLTDSDGTIVVDGLTVGTSLTDVIIDNTSITSGQTVSFNATSTITHG